MKIFIWSCALVGLVATGANAQLLVNGDFDDPVSENGWTRWQAPWTVGAPQWTDLPGPSTGDLDLPPGSFSSYGWYQVVALPNGTVATIDGLWEGDVNPLGWAEVMLFSVPVGTPAATIVNQIDVGAAGDIAYKKDGWGQNTPPEVWGWEVCSLSPATGGNAGTTTSVGWVVVGLKIGTGTWNPGHNGISAHYDNLVLVPEPASALLLGLPMLLLRRRR